MTHPTPDLRALKQAAAMATQGERYVSGNETDFWAFGNKLISGSETVSSLGEIFSHTLTEADARFLAQANPSTVLWLIERVAVLEEWIRDAATCRCLTDWTERGLHMTECLYRDAPDGINPPSVNEQKPMPAVRP